MKAFQHSCQLYREKLMNVQGEDIPEDIRAKSPQYLRYLLTKHRLDQMVLWGIPSNRLFNDLIKEVAGKCTPALHDRLLVYFVLDNKMRFSPEEFEKVLSGIYADVADSFCLGILNSLKTLTVGEPILDVSLPDKNGKKISLSGFKNKIVLLDFYFASCAPCKAYFREIVKPVFESYKGDSRVLLVSISIDSKTTFLRTVEQGSLAVENAIHLYTDNKGSGHSLIRYYKINIYPTPILLDGNGTILAYGKELRNKEGLSRLIDKGLLDL